MRIIDPQASGRRWLVWATASVITLSAIYGILILRHWCDNSHRIVTLMGEIEGQANRLSAIEWEAMSRKSLTQELKHSRQQVSSQLVRDFNELRQHVEDESFWEIRRVYSAYVQATDEEFHLLESARFAEALKVDDDKVDTAYAELIDLISRARLRYTAAARWTMLAVDIGSSLLLVLAAISIGVLFSRYERLQRGRQVLLAEQKALRRSEQRFRSLVHNTSDIIAVLDPLPPTITFVSDSIRRILGHRPEDLIGSDIFTYVHPNDAAVMQRFIASCAYNVGATYVAEVRIRHHNGDWSVVEAFGDNRMNDSAVRGIVVNFRDVSERKRIEEDPDQQQIELELSERKLH
ncbi:MAG: PAS domain S-box protein [Deltaproteobacteria bacterium]|nr:PAS domain S-box protein [Deltaproteobacteria bacterium]